MGQLRSSIDQFKGDVRAWLAKVTARGQTDIYQPLMRSQAPADSPEAYKLYADYQERIHELNLLIRFLQRFVSVTQQRLGAMPHPSSGHVSGRFRLIPLDPSLVPDPPLDTPDLPLGVRLMPVAKKTGGTEHIRMINASTLSVSHPAYQTLLRLIQLKAERQPSGTPRVPSLE